MSKNHGVIPAWGKSAKKFVALLESNGFEFDRVNSKGICFYVHPVHPEQRVNPLMNDAVLHQQTRRVQRAVGLDTKQDRSKRDAQKVKDRQAREREQAAEEYARIIAERDRLVAERDAFAARFGVASVGEANALIAQIEKAERELRYWSSLMTETPSSGGGGTAHAKHRS